MPKSPQGLLSVWRTSDSTMSPLSKVKVGSERRLIGKLRVFLLAQLSFYHNRWAQGPFTTETTDLPFSPILLQTRKQNNREDEQAYNYPITLIQIHSLLVMGGTRVPQDITCREAALTLLQSFADFRLSLIPSPFPCRNDGNIACNSL